MMYGKLSVLVRCIEQRTCPMSNFQIYSIGNYRELTSRAILRAALKLYHVPMAKATNWRIAIQQAPSYNRKERCV